MIQGHDFDAITFCSLIAPKDADPVLWSLVVALALVYVFWKMRYEDREDDRVSEPLISASLEVSIAEADSRKKRHNSV